MKNYKPLLLSLFCTIFLTNNTFSQTIFTADNNPGALGGTNVFTGATALQDAIAATTSGDIIHITPGNTNYGIATIDKPLNIFGIGLNPDIDGTLRSRVDTIIIADPAASGTRISGVFVNDAILLGGTAGALSNLLIENGLVRRVVHTDVTTTLSNIIIRNNVMGWSLSNDDMTILLLHGAMSNIVIANNIIYGTSLNEHGAVQASNGTSVENNIFVGSDGNDHAFYNFYSNSVKNNVFIRKQPTAHSSFSNNAFENNIQYLGAVSFATTVGNTSVNNIDADPQLTNVPHTQSADFAVLNPAPLAGSPCIGNGEGGTDIGVYGGAVPFSLQGTLIPLIQSITVPTMVVEGDDLEVQIKARGN
ncbi:MAG: hypothetical protein JXR07_15575 [Reichenbachiella sp.]